jgi:hypothetical protein
MEYPTGESDNGALRVYFARRLRLEFHDSRISSDAGLLAYRELNEAPGLTGLAGDVLFRRHRGTPAIGGGAMLRISAILGPPGCRQETSVQMQTRGPRSLLRPSATGRQGHGELAGNPAVAGRRDWSLGLPQRGRIGHPSGKSRLRTLWPN